MVLAAAALTLSGCNCFKKMGKKQDEVTYSCTPKVLTLNNGVVSADITVNFPAAYFNKKATLRLTPVIVFEGGEVAGTPKYVQGEKVNDNYTVISADNGGTYTQHVEFPYDDRMEQSELRVLIESKCNGASEYAMINASNVAMEFHQALPVMARPETTEGRQGFYHLCQMYGDVTEAKLGYILRDHDAGKLQFKKDNLLHIACYLNGKYGDGTVEVEIKDSYRNMIEKIKPHFHLVENARKAIEKAGLTPEEVPVRGGTDGAVLSWKGLPCPNLGTGGFNFHGVCECTTVERMDKAAEVLLNIVEIYSK